MFTRGSTISADLQLKGSRRYLTRVITPISNPGTLLTLTLTTELVTTRAVITQFLFALQQPFRQLGAIGELGL
jgi:hypothetical protein